MRGGGEKSKIFLGVRTKSKTFLVGGRRRKKSDVGSLMFKKGRGKNKGGVKRHFVYAVDSVLLIGVLVTLLMIIGYSNPRIIAPLDELETTQSSIIFSIENAEELWIDNNINFTSPEKIYLKGEYVLELEPGVYYWKAKGLRESEIRTLTIKSLVVLELRESEKGYDVINGGNVNLNVEVYNGSNLVDNLSVGKGKIVESKGDKFIGEMS